jgi:hypothetical protein
MALSKTFELDGKVFIETDAGRIFKHQEKISIAAYIKVVSISGNKTSINAVVSFSEKDVLLEKNYCIPVNVNQEAKNFIAQVYEHLKTLPEFAGATNC